MKVIADDSIRCADGRNDESGNGRACDLNKADEIL
jgi:hypothetical protein